MILDILISPAFAQGSAEQGNILLNLLPLVLLFAVFYFLLIRPQQKKAKEHKKMVGELTKGDEIITQGGILAKIVDTDEVFLKIEIAPGTIITAQRNSIGVLMPKGTYKDHIGREKSKSDDEIATKPKTRRTRKTKESES